jgi:hypothetical protein
MTLYYMVEENSRGKERKRVWIVSSGDTFTARGATFDVVMSAEFPVEDADKISQLIPGRLVRVQGKLSEFELNGIDRKLSVNLNLNDAKLVK